MMERTKPISFSPRRRGAIFITALGIIVILSGLMLVFAQNMRTEALASANRLSYIEADAVEQGAEQWVMALVDQYKTDAWDLVQIPAEQIQVGNGYFWLIRPDDDTDQEQDYGIIDECSKLNLNTVTSTQLLSLPTPMTQDVADAIEDWRKPASQATTDGAETDYYQSLPEPYSCKNAPFETVEELFLVKGITPQLLFGLDLNRDGVIDQSERDAQGTSSMFSGAPNESRGIYRYLTAYTTGEQSLGIVAARNRRGRVAAAGPAPVGRVNVNTAPEAVLMALGLPQSQADTLIQQRAGTDINSTATLQQALGGPAPAGFTLLVTTTSDQYSADIVAVSGDGRSFKRVLIVVDCQKSPCKIIYRRDLSSYGWPLPEDIRTSLRAGQPIAPTAGGTNGLKS